MVIDEINPLWTRDELLKATKEEDINQTFLLKNKITGISIDTRSLNKGDLFIALSGKNYNGNVFVEVAIKKGASGFITDNKDTAKQFSGLLVTDTDNALKNLAIYARKRYKGEVIAITGSTGKTSTKNMLSKTLSSFGKTHSTYENNNNFYGLCLTLSRLQRHFDYCILELGMNKKNELRSLSKLARPNLIMITNVSSSHIGNFLSEKQIAIEKSEIFSGLTLKGKIILNGNDTWFDFLKKRALVYTDLIYSFGTKSNSEIEIKEIYNKNNGTFLKINNLNLFFKQLPIHHVINLTGILVILKLMNLNLKKIINQICDFKPTTGRGNRFDIVLNNNKKATVIDDSYNANPASMMAALDNIREIKLSGSNVNIILVIGDMLELGKGTNLFHEELIPKIKLIKPRYVITVGNFAKIISKKLCKTIPCQSFENVNKLKKSFFSIIKDNDIILIKGSNGIGLYKFTKFLYKTSLHRS